MQRTPITSGCKQYREIGTSGDITSKGLPAALSTKSRE